MPLQRLKVFGKSEQVVTEGYQLFDASKLPSKSQGGATVTNNGDGSFTVSGSGNLTEVFDLNFSYSSEDAKKIFKIGAINKSENATNPIVSYHVKYNGKTENLGNNITEEMYNANDFTIKCIFYGSKNAKIVGGIVKPMLYQEGDGTWEPFTGGKPSPSPDNPSPIVSVGDKGNIGISIDGNPQQKLRIETPNGLPGIKVDSGENYTDSNGQQWICDEIDLERGKYVKRIGKFIYDGSIDENWVPDTGFSDCIRFYIQENKMMRLTNYKDRILCNRLKSEKSHNDSRELCITGYATAPYSYPGENWIYVNGMNQFKKVSELKTWLQNNPLEVYILLKTPIEHDLTPEEIADYKALHTEHPTTIFTNDENAEMELTYTVDTKTYVDKKIAEISTAIMQKGN